jgi:hypothetical protein
MIAPEVDVETSILKPRGIVVKNAEVTVATSFDGAKTGFGTWRRKLLGAGGGGAPSASALPRIVTDGMHVVWNAPFGDGKLEALAVHAEVDDRGTWDEVHVMAPHVTLVSKGANIGPWRVDYDRDAKTARVRIAFDPQVPDGANALIVGDGDVVTSADVNVARTPLAHLGIDPAALGLPSGDTTQIEAKLEYRHLDPRRAQARAHLGLHGIKLARVPTDLDATLDAAGEGDPDKEIDVKRGTLAFGPLKGTVAGTLKTFDGGFRVELGWKGGPVPCTAFLTIPPPPGAPPDPVRDIRQQLGQLAAATGLAQVAGEIEIDARLLLDTRDLAETQLAVSEPKQCL